MTMPAKQSRASNHYEFLIMQSINLDFKRLLNAILFFAYFCISPIFSDSLILLEREVTSQIPGSKLYFLSDQTNSLTIEDIQTDSFNERFVPYGDESPVLGFSSFTYWFKFRIKKTHNNPNQYYIVIRNHSLDKIAFYQYLYLNDSSLSLRHTIAGDNYSSNIKKVKFREYIFEPDLSGDGISTVYFKIESTASLFIPIYIYQKEYFESLVFREELIYGIFYGTLITLFLYNLAIFLYSKEVTYFYYIGYILSYLLMEASSLGHTYLYLWPEKQGWENASVPFFVGLTIFFSTLFSKSFLKLSIYSPFFNRIFILFSIFGLLVSVIVFFFPMMLINIIITLLSLIVLSLILFSGIYIYNKKFKPAGIFIFAWVCFTIGSIFTILRLFGLMEYSILSVYGIQFGSFIEMILLSIALTKKIDIIKDENQEAIKRTIIFQEQANAELEKKVKERTAELNKSLISIEKDLTMARNIQINILPKNLDSILHFNIKSLYIPLDKVGGDFYDVCLLTPRKLRILIADATGHGVQASMITMSIKSDYESLKMFILDPGELIDELQKRFLEIYRKMNTYFTAFIVDIDLDENKIIYASAGHPSQYLIRKNTLIELNRTGHILGLVSNKTWISKSLPFEKNDKLFLFTDGLYEEFNHDYEQFGDDRLKTLLQDHINSSIDELIDTSLLNLNIHLGEKKKQDDITIVAVEGVYDDK